MGWRYFVVAFAAVHSLCGAGLAQRSSTGAALTTTIHWDQVPLGDAVQRIIDKYNVAVFTDRRVDHSRRIDLDVRNADAHAALAQTAAAAELGLSRLGPLSYLGPPATTDRLRTLVELGSEELAALPAGLRSSIERKRLLDWPRLAEPRAVVSGVIAERGWTISGAERIPHDLWPAGRLPAMTMIEQLSVLLAGSDLTFRLVEPKRVVEIIELAEPVALSRKYRLRYGASDKARIAQLFPAAKMQLEGEWLTVLARIEDHERLAESLQGAAGPTQAMQAARPPARPAKKVYSLRVEDKPVRAILTPLAQKLNWQIEIDEASIQAAGLSLDSRVSFDVADVDADELLGALLRPAGLGFRREGENVRIIAGRGRGG